MFEVNVELIPVTTVFATPLEVPVEEFDDVEQVDFFLVNEHFILPPPMVPAGVSSNIDCDTLEAPSICPGLLIMLQGVEDKLIGVKIVAGVGSAFNGNGEELIELLLLSIFMLKHCVGANTCGGEGTPLDDAVTGICIPIELFSSTDSGSTLMKSFKAEAGSGSTRFLMTEGRGLLEILGVEITDTGADGAFDA